MRASNCSASRTARTNLREGCGRCCTVLAQRLRTRCLRHSHLGLPGMSGAELVQQARKLRPHLKVIVASGYSEPEPESGQLAGTVYLRRPFTLIQLKQAFEV